MAILFHCRSTPRRVDHNGVDVCFFEASDHLPSEMSGLLFQTRVNHKGPAACLRPRDNHLTTFSSKNTRGGLVDVLKEDLLYASGQHADTSARRGNRHNTGWKTTK